MSARTLLLSLALLLIAAAPANAAIVINEIETQGTPDWVELTNTGVAAVDVSGYVISDSNDGNDAVLPAGTVLAAGGYLVADLAFGLGNPDSVRLFAPADLVNPIDRYDWTAHPATSYGRCPSGTGPIVSTQVETRLAANTCPLPALAWPGGTGVTFADAAGAFTDNVSGLAYQPSGTSAPGVLWAVRNGPSTLYRLVWDGTKWTPDTADGWGAGKTLRYPNMTGAPDAEGLTLVDGEPNAIYVSVERDGNGGSAPGVLRYDVSQPGTTLDAGKEWSLTADLPPLGANAGLEAIGWVPDSLLVAKGLVDDSRGGARYDPANYPGHGLGLFFVGVEDNGGVIGYALTPAGYTRITSAASGFATIMGLEYEPESTHLWAVCDNSCDGRIASLDIDGTGHLAVSKVYDRPVGMVQNLNNEGFAIAPQAECVGGLKPVFWTDDSATDSHALRAGTFSCTPPVPVDPSPTATATPVATVSPQPTVAPTPVPSTPTDRIAPKVRITLTKPAKKGTYAVRKTGKLKLTITLDERSDLTIKVSARKTKRAKLRTLTTTTRKGVAAGKPRYTLTLSKKVRKALKAGEKLTIAVQARDAAGNVGTGSASGTVR